MYTKIKKLRLDSQKQKFFTQIIITLFLRVLGIVTLFFITKFITTNYPSSIVGKYDFIRVFLLVLSSITIFGTDQSIVYFSGILKKSNQMYELKNIYKKSLIMIIAFSLMLLIVLLSIGKDIINGYFNDSSYYKLLLQALFTLSFYSVTLFNTETIRALGKINLAELFRNTFKYFSLIIGAILLLQYEKEQYLPETFLVGFIFLSIVSTAIIIFEFRKKKYIEKSTHFTSKQIFKTSYPMGLSNLAIFLLLGIDVMFLKKHFGDKEIAYYSLAVKINGILLMIMNTVTITVSPKIAEFFAQSNYEKLNEIMRYSSRIIFFASLFISFITIIFIEPILNFFGKEYVISKTPLIILLLFQTVSSLFGAVQVYMNMTGKQGLFQRILFISVIFSILLNSYLIPKFGMEGAAFSYGISLLFWNITVSIFVFKNDAVRLILR